MAVLVEKPMAAQRRAEADAIVEAAARKRRQRWASGTPSDSTRRRRRRCRWCRGPRFIEIHRLGTFPERSLDIDVMFDLMIHDLDLLLPSVGSDVVDLEVVGVNVLTPKADIANARIRFASGCIANLTASRISREKVRKARFFQQDAYVSIDFARAGGGDVPAGAGQRPAGDRGWGARRQRRRSRCTGSWPTSWRAVRDGAAAHGRRRGRPDARRWPWRRGSPTRCTVPQDCHEHDTAG